MTEEKKEIINANLAAEYFVASQLFRKGYAATMTFGPHKAIDIIVQNPATGELRTIDVKGLKTKSNWPLQPKLQTSNHFFVLVSFLNKMSDLKSTPDVFVIPSLDIGTKVSLHPWPHEKPRQTSVLYGEIKDTQYRDAWHLLFSVPEGIRSDNAKDKYSDRGVHSIVLK